LIACDIYFPSLNSGCNVKAESRDVNNQLLSLTLLGVVYPNQLGVMKDEFIHNVPSSMI